jgi:quercetin dioxygenase-like cupin family protein
MEKSQMRAEQLLEKLEFHDDDPYAQPLFVDQHGRIIRFMLKPGQSITKHNAPHSPFYLVVLQGQGVFSGGDGQEQQFGPNTLLVFDMAEDHSVRALDENLIFVGFLQGVQTARPGRVGGELGREEEQ